MENIRKYVMTILMVGFICLSNISIAQDRDRANLVKNKELDFRFGQLFDNIENTQQYGIMELLRMEEDFSRFVKLIEDAGFEDSIRRMDGITLLAPVDYAFEMYSEEQELENLSNRDLTTFIKAHILPKNLPFSGFKEGQKIESASGEEWLIDQEEILQGEGPPYVFIGESRIVKSDVKASNGVIHVIDGLVASERKE